jgi:hypothetical protein
MAVDPLALHSQVRRHHHDANCVGPPAPLHTNQPRHNPKLDVQGVQSLLHVAQVALGFDDQQRAGLGLPAEDVHRSSVAVVVERVLDRRFPSVPSEPFQDCLDQCGVAPIDLALDRRASQRPRRERQLDPDGLGHSTN